METKFVEVPPCYIVQSCNRSLNSIKSELAASKAQEAELLDYPTELLEEQYSKLAKLADDVKHITRNLERAAFRCIAGETEEFIIHMANELLELVPQLIRETSEQGRWIATLLEDAKRHEVAEMPHVKEKRE